ncbi:TPA: DUF3265 domain-containing protein, partial [Vibrio vulnificus]|nr:DUF3265 domain-containing protein [Vibrio vulnificus]HDY7571981.1 DUF3265 domain-containing protein [Vibrio vulnificus]
RRVLVVKVVCGKISLCGIHPLTRR